MVKKIDITVGQVKAEAELNESKTAKAIWQALPIKGEADLWGDEIYFPIRLSLDLEDGQETVKLGDLGYWPEGKCFCIFFGRTPISQGNEIRPASAVSVFGKVIGDPAVFKKAAPGAEIIISKEK